MLFTQVGAELCSGCPDLPKLLLVHSHQLLLCLAQFPALLFKDFYMQGQRGKKKKRRRNITEDQKIHILHKAPFPVLHAVEQPLPPSSLPCCSEGFTFAQGSFFCVFSILRQVGWPSYKRWERIGHRDPHCFLMGGFMGLHEGSALKRS